MICSFVLGLRNINKSIEDENIKIKKYVNYDYIKKILLKEGISYEEIKKITISNFLTKDKFFKDKTYYIKISSLDSQCTLKLLKLLFFYKITNHTILVCETEFRITNIYHNSFWAKQLEFDKFQERELQYKLKINILTPMFFKVGNQYISSLNCNYIIKNLIKKLKNSSLYNENIESFLKTFDINKIKINEENTEKKYINKLDVEGITGSIIFEIEKNISEKHLLFFNLLIYFSFFSGIGYMTEKGYGQIILDRDNYFQKN